MAIWLQAGPGRTDTISIVPEPPQGKGFDMGRPKPSEEELLEKIRRLAPERVAEVEDFVDFLRQRDEEGLLSNGAARLSEAAFAKVWENSDDADYDRL